MLVPCNIKYQQPGAFKPFNRTKLDILGDNKEYTFNSLGYRSEEYNPKAKKHIFVCGCSYTFGVGLDIEETWPSIFKEIYSKDYQYKSGDVNILNFSVPDHSNDYITRILIDQANRVKPNMIIANFTHSNRTEYIDGDKVSYIFPESAQFSSDAQNYYSYYTDELGFINTVKNMLLLQFFCRTNNIALMISWIELEKLTDNKFTSNPVCSSFLSLLDKKSLCDFRLNYYDYASDKNHPGLKSNIQFAYQLFKFYKKSFSNRNN